MNCTITPLPALTGAIMMTSSDSGSPSTSAAGAENVATPGGRRKVLSAAAAEQGGAKPPPHMGAPPSPESNDGLGDGSLPSAVVASPSIGERVVRSGLGRRAAAVRQALGFGADAQPSNGTDSGDANEAINIDVASDGDWEAEIREEYDARHRRRRR